jgi:hypothetical protein
VYKIVVLSDQSEGNEGLIASITMLFPECEIQILSKGREGAGDLPLAQGPGTFRKGEDVNDKHIDC